MEDVRDRIKSEILQAFWRDLKDHAERDALFVVTAELDLVDVGEAIVKDEAARVGRWIESGKIARPTPEQLEAWNAEPARSFRSVIVAPYVLMQEAGH